MPWGEPQRRDDGGKGACGMGGNLWHPRPDNLWWGEAYLTRSGLSASSANPCGIAYRST